MITDRFSWALQLINPGAKDIILEIGCGTGILASMIAEQLKTGKVVAIDRSAPMIAKAKSKNLSIIESGKMELIQHHFSPADFRVKSFDKIVAFNVNLFMGKGNVSMNDIGRLLKTNGKLYLFFQAPYKLKLSDIKPIETNLIEANFIIEEIKIENIQKSNAAFILASFQNAK
jgi:SAM-dependent methyltransferase